MGESGKKIRHLLKGERKSAQSGGGGGGFLR